MNSKRFLAGILALACAMVFWPQFALAQSGVVVRLSPATATVAVGSTVTVDVLIDNVNGLQGAELHLLFDNARLEVVDAMGDQAGIQVAHGGFVAPDHVAKNEVVDGAITYAVMQMAPHTAVSGNGTLARITFRGIASGPANVAFVNVLLADTNGQAIANTPQNGSVTVGEVTVSPTPTATPVTTTPTPTPGPITVTPTPITGTPTPTPVPGSAVMRFNPASVVLNQVGQTTMVGVYLEGVNNLYGCDVTVTYNPAVVDVVDADGGAAGIQVGHGNFLSPQMVARNQVDPAVGRISYAISQRDPQAPVNGSGTLFFITFKAKATGATALNVTGQQLARKDGSVVATVTQSGNIVVEKIVTPTCGAPQGYHVVRAGETLYSIGRAYTTLPAVIARCNNIVNASALYVGVRLAIPVACWSPVPAGPVAQRQFTPAACGAPPTPTDTPQPTCRATYIVQPRDTLYGIALRYGVNMWALARLNAIYNLNLIYVGQKLCIP